MSSPEHTPEQTLDRQYLQMRERLLSLAADFDRIDRVGPLDDDRLGLLRRAGEIALSDQPGRAERLQMLLSDKTPPPAR